MDRDTHRAAVEAGYAPLKDYIAVNIAADIYDEMAAYAKRTHCTAETAVNAALAEWLGRV